jgi:hypothetical protein
MKMLDGTFKYFKCTIQFLCIINGHCLSIEYKYYSTLQKKQMSFEELINGPDEPNELTKPVGRRLGRFQLP